jgi:transposase-like protein
LNPKCCSSGRHPKLAPCVTSRICLDDQIIVLCVRWYLRYSLSYRDLEEMMAERNLGIDHSTIELRRAVANPAL